jgi:hypothetical protein
MIGLIICISGFVLILGIAFLLLLIKTHEDGLYLNKKQTEEFCDFLVKLNREDAKKLLEIIK